MTPKKEETQTILVRPGITSALNQLMTLEETLSPGPGLPLQLSPRSLQNSVWVSSPPAKIPPHHPSVSRKCQQAAFTQKGDMHNSTNVATMLMQLCTLLLESQQFLRIQIAKFVFHNESA